MKNPSRATETALLKAAKKVQKNSHSPYSGYKVASAILFEKNKIFAGINVENASYGATNCAERTAIFSAVAAGFKRIQAVLVLTDKGWPPCGVCRQVIAEFAQDDTVVLIADKGGIKSRVLFKDLLPSSFNKKHL